MKTTQSLAILLLFLCASPLVIGEESKELYAKTYLSPFYRESMSQGVSYAYNLSVVSSGNATISSAIIGFDIYLSPSVRFNLSVNNKACNNPSYYVSTSYAGSAQSRVLFDCSNVITKPGKYVLSLLPTGQNTGSVSAWAEITYSTTGSGALTLSGTEYSPGDAATIFLQLKDNQGLPINNGSCYVDIYYPLVNGSHPYIVQDAPMIFASNGDDGLYYYDLVAPSQVGVYMLSAKCQYPFNWLWYFGRNEQIFKPILGVASSVGTWFNSTVALNSPSDSMFFECDVAGGGAGCKGNFSFNLSAYGLLTNISSISLYYAGQLKSSGSNPWNLDFSYWNGSAFVRLQNNIVMVHQAIAPNGVDQYLSNAIPASAAINNIVVIYYNLSGGTGTSTTVWNDWLSLAVLSSAGTLQDVKGSGEMHVTLSPCLSVNQSVNFWGDLTNSTQNTLLLAINNANNTNVGFFYYVNGSLQNISSQLQSLNVTCSNSNATINVSCPSINYSKINDSCAGFFEKNGGEIMWVMLILIGLCIIIGEVARTNWLRVGAVLASLVFLTMYYTEQWYYIAFIVLTFYALYAIYMMSKVEQWVGGGR